ncbi:MAG TPA: 4-hydroxy-tetrahydrodipicolinate reductase [Catalimonadaceae bacterium]|nr:4-hydroxy-tetrahydrodipicolinate reductase [Catalimonadaceae bacterium]
MKDIQPEKLRILLIGYGKMGKAIETIATQRGHSITAIVSDKQMDVEHICRSYQPNIAFEFTSPEAAVQNLKGLISAGIPTVCGSTGWLSQWNEIAHLVKEKNGSFFYASNFSMGMNLLFKLAELAGRFMNELPDYDIDIAEIHHTEKKDIPSGTAITLAEKLIHEVTRKTAWVVNDKPEAGQIQISALREPSVPGTHTITFSSAIDTIEMSHTAHSRMGFADGAVRAGEWLLGKKGIHSMDDFLKDRFRLKEGA